MVTISLISTNRTMPFHLNSLNTKKDHDIWRRKSRSWLGTDKNVTVLNRLIGSQSSPSWYLDLQRVCSDCL